jgi:hypothetical protein
VKLDYGSGDYSIQVCFRLPAVFETALIIEGRNGDNEGLRIATIGNTLYASHNTIDNTHSITSLYGDGLFHTLVVTRVGGVFTSVIDGGTPVVNAVSTDLTPTTNVAFGVRYGGAADFFTGELSQVIASDRFTLPISEGFGPLLDISGLGNDSTTNTADWTVADGIPSWNHSKGFTQYEFTTTDYVAQDYWENLGSSSGAPSGASYFSSDDTLYVATRDGLYSSADKGETQVLIDNVSSLDTLQPRSVFVTSTGTIFWSPWATGEMRRSTDDGVSFHDNLTLGPSGEKRGMWGFDECAITGDLYAAVYSLILSVDDASLYRSQNGGDSWTLVLPADTDRHIHSVKVDPSNGYVYVTTGDTLQHVLRSTDRGENFEDLVALSSGNQYITIEFFNGMRIFGEDQSPSGKIFTTSDDINFIERYDSTTTTPSADIAWFCSWQYNGRIYQAALAETADQNARIISSADGITWILDEYGELATTGFPFSSRASSDGFVYVNSPNGSAGVGSPPGTTHQNLLIDLNRGVEFGGVGEYANNLLDNSAMKADTADTPVDWSTTQTSGITNGLTKISSSVSTLFPDATEWRMQIDAGDGTGTGGYLRLRQFLPLPITDSDEYTASVFVKGSSYSGGIAITVWEGTAGFATIRSRVLRVPFTEDADFVRYSQTFKTDAVGVVNVYVSFGIYSVDAISEIDVTFACPQVEVGTTLKPFCTKLAGEGV